MLKKRDVAIFVMFAIIFLHSLVPKNFLDLWWHLASGKYILANGVPMHDIFSHTVSGREWIDHEWLSQVFLYSVFSRFGLNSLLVVEAFFVLASFLLIYRRAAMIMGQEVAVVALVLSYWIFGSYSLAESVRPYFFSIFFVSLFLLILDNFIKNGGRYILALPLVMILWCNLHGGFVIGILLLFIYSLGQAISKDYAGAKKLSSLALLSLAASLINPNTYRLLLYPLQYARNSIHLRFISEWQSPSFHELGMFELALLSTILIMAYYRRPVNATDLILLLVFTHFSLFAARNISLFAVVCVPIIVKYMELVARDHVIEKFDTGKVKKFFLPSFFYSLILLGTVSFLYYYPVDRVLYGDPESGLPSGATGYLQESEMGGNMFNYYRWGGYAIWKLYPEHRVFVDGRADLYGEFIYDYAKVARLEPGWYDVLEEHDVGFVLIPRTEPLGEMLIEKGWDVAYKDDVSVVLKRGDRDAG